MTDPTPPFPRIPKASRSKVWEAADAILLGTGERPTVEGIRQRLGGGSPNSVTAYLNEWYRELAERLSAADAPIEGVPIAALALLRDLWRVAKEGQGTGRKTIQEVDGLAEAELGALKAQVKALETLNQELRRHRATTEKALVEAKALLSHREATAAEDRERLVELEAALAGAHLEVTALRARQRRRPAAAPGPVMKRRAKPQLTARPKPVKAKKKTGKVSPTKLKHAAKSSGIPKRHKAPHTRPQKARRRQ